jgi:hypothetical protein
VGLGQAAESVCCPLGVHEKVAKLRQVKDVFQKETAVGSESIAVWKSAVLPTISGSTSGGLVRHFDAPWCRTVQDTQELTVLNEHLCSSLQLGAVGFTGT